MQLQINISEFLYDLFQRTGLQISQTNAEIIAGIVIFILTLIIGWVAYVIFERFFMRWAKKTKTTLDDEILRNIKIPVFLFILLIGFYQSIYQISLLSIFSFQLAIIFSIAEIFLVAFIITRVINVVVAWYADRNTKKYGTESNNHILFILRKAINLIIYIFAFFVILFVNEIDLSGAVVGLGVGGIAIAFALQSILSDVFSAFSIYFDRPFEIGDFIVFGEYSGTVQKISMKSTRVQLLRGEELIIPNKELTSTSVRNFKKMTKRRAEFTLGVTYDTPLEKLKKIPDLVEKAVTSCEHTEFYMVHFRSFGNFSLDFGVVFYIDTGDYKQYLDIQHQINYKIKEAFEKEGIEIAFPTQTIFLNQQPTKNNLIPP